MIAKPFVSVVIFCDTRDSSLIPTVSRLIERLPDLSKHFEVILVDVIPGNKCPAALDAALKTWANVRYFQFEAPITRQDAIVFGIAQALGEMIVTMPPALASPVLLESLLERLSTSPGIHVGVRQQALIPWVRRRIGRLFYSVARNAFGVALVPFPSTVIALDRDSASRLKKVPERLRYAKGLMNKASLQVQTFELGTDACANHLDRGFWIAVNLGFDLIVFNSVRPLRLMTYGSVFFGCLDFMYLVYAIAMRLLGKGIAPGWATLSIQSAVQYLFLSAVLATLSEYFARTLIENQGASLPPKYERNSAFMAARPNVIETKSGNG